jgi:hypothetical protein
VPYPTHNNLTKILSEELPNLPTFYWKKKPQRKAAKSCAKLPALSDLHFSNIYWQILETRNGTFSLYSAFLDDRILNILGPTVRILGMINRRNPTQKTFCQIWFDFDKWPVISEVFEYRYIWREKWGNSSEIDLFQAS